MLTTTGALSRKLRYRLFALPTTQLGMADVVGVEHVVLGTDMLGFISQPVFRSYAQLPSLGDALLGAGFSPRETEQILGGNYRRVFEASMV
jgi:membrane dipeptidase